MNIFTTIYTAFNNTDKVTAEMLKLYNAPYFRGILISLLTINPKSESAKVSNIPVKKYVKNVDINTVANIFTKTE